MTPAAVENFGPLGPGRCRAPPARAACRAGPGRCIGQSPPPPAPQRPRGGRAERTYRVPARFFPPGNTLTRHNHELPRRESDAGTAPAGRAAGIGVSGRRRTARAATPRYRHRVAHPRARRGGGAERRCRRWPQGGAGGSSFAPAQTSSQQTVRVSPPVAAAGKHPAAQIHEWSVACPPACGQCGGTISSSVLIILPSVSSGAPPSHTLAAPLPYRARTASLTPARVGSTQ